MDNPPAQPAPSRQPATGRDQEVWEPTIHDVLLAQQRMTPHLTPTPLLKPAALARALSCAPYPHPRWLLTAQVSSASRSLAAVAFPPVIGRITVRPARS